MKKLENAPKVGEKFGIKASHLYKLRLLETMTTDYGNFVRLDPEMISTFKVLQDKYLILTYLGNGLCEEYYTKKIIPITFPVYFGMTINQPLKVNRQLLNQEVLNEYQKALNLPLIFFASSPTYGYELTLDFLIKFREANYGFEEEIKKALNEAEPIARETLKQDLENIKPFIGQKQTLKRALVS